MGDAKGKSIEKTHGAMDDVVLINIKYSNGTKIAALRVDLKLTVAELKELIARSCDVPAAQQRLIHQGMVLEDKQTLQSYGLQAEHTVYMITDFAPSGSPSTTTTANTPVGGSTNGGASVGGASPGAASCGVRLRTSPLTASEFNILGGNGMPRMDQMQQYLSQNADRMKQIMSMPSVQNLMNNPELMRTMVMNTPQSRDIYDRNPEFANLLNDPVIMSQALEKARTPEFMRQMTQNTGVTPNSPAVPPAQRYATQLSRLQEKGYLNTEANIRALQATSGNVQAAVERLKNNLG